MSDKHVLDMITDYCRRQIDTDPMKCLCSGWPRQCPTEEELKGHHPACPVAKQQRDEARTYAAKANDLWQGAMDALATVENEGEAARAEVAYLRRQIKLEENFRDPEFGGCVHDPEKPEHLRRDERTQD